MRKRFNRRHRILWYSVPIFLLITLMGGLLQRWIRPAVETRLVYQAKTYVTVALEQVVLQELEKMELSCDAVSRITREEGKVLSVETDVVLLNRLKSKITQSAAQQLQQLSQYELTLPLGAVLGIDMLANQGPDISFALQPQTAIVSEIGQEFSSAGVNQTLHRIYLQLEVQVAAAIPGFSAETRVRTQTELAHTLIVGEVPQFLAG